MNLIKSFSYDFIFTLQFIYFTLQLLIDFDRLDFFGRVNLALLDQVLYIALSTFDKDTFFTVDWAHFLHEMLHRLLEFRFIFFVIVFTHLLADMDQAYLLGSGTKWIFFKGSLWAVLVKVWLHATPCLALSKCSRSTEPLSVLGFWSVSSKLFFVFVEVIGSYSTYLLLIEVLGCDISKVRGAVAFISSLVHKLIGQQSLLILNILLLRLSPQLLNAYHMVYHCLLFETAFYFYLLVGA